VQLNHYSLRSTGEFMLKMQRGLPNKMDLPIDFGYWAARNWNTVSDTLISRHTGDTTWITPEIHALHEDAVTAHAARFEAMMQTPDMVQLFWRLQLAGGSSEPTLPMAQAHLTRLQKAKS